MRQNSVIFAALFLAFVVFITIKGKLAAYITLLWPQHTQGVTPPDPAKTNPGGVFGPGAGIFTGAGATDYLNSLPASDQGFMAGMSGWWSGYYPSGLPTVPTLSGLTNQAGAYVAGGAAGL